MVLMLVGERFNADKLEDGPQLETGLPKSQETKPKKK